MPDIKRRDKRQNNGTSFNKPEYGIGRPVGFNQVPGSSSLRLLGAFAHSSHVHAPVNELNSRTTGDDELSLLLSHLLLPLPSSSMWRQNWTVLHQYFQLSFHMVPEKIYFYYRGTVSFLGFVRETTQGGFERDVEENATVSTRLLYDCFCCPFVEINEVTTKWKIR